MLRKKLILAGFLALLAGPSLAANAYISEFGALTSTASSTLAQAAPLPPLAEQKVDFTAGATASSAFSAQTRYIRVHCDAACSIRVGGTATTSFMRIPLDGVEYFGVQPGATLSVIANP